MIENVLLVSLIGGIVTLLLYHLAILVETVLSFHSRLTDEATLRTWRHLPRHTVQIWDWNRVLSLQWLPIVVGFTATFIGYTFLVGLTVVFGL